MIRTKIVAVPKGSATSVLNPYKSNNGSSSISPSTGSGSSGSGSSGDSTKDCLWQTGDGDSSIISKGSDDLTSNMLEVAIGQYNKTTKDKTSFSVGNGTSTTDRSNAFEVQNDGTAIAPTFQSGVVNTATINSTTINNANNIVNDGNIVNTGNINNDGDITNTGNFSNSKDITNTGNFNNGGNITNDGNITNAGTLKTAVATVDNDLTVGKSVTAKTINADVGNIKDIYSDNITNKKMIKTKDLTVTGTAHFFELVIDKIKAAGGAAIFTPADGFDIDVVEAVENGYKLYWRCEVDGKVRQNMWKVNDQAICMSFNQAKIGTSYNVSNKYYWSLVTAVSDSSKPVIRDDGNKYNWITISTVTFDGTVNPEVGDSIAMLGYRGTDDEARQSAIYITAYASFDKGVEPPFIAQYKGIKDFDIEKYRTSWWSLKTNKFVGDFVIESSGQNVLDYVNDKINTSSGDINNTITEFTTSINEKYSALNVKVDGINTKVVNNTTSITKLGENLNATNKNLEETNKNLDTTNSNITKLENTVKENYSTLDQKADSIDAKVTSNTNSITKLGTNLETTNSNITELETSVNKKYAELNVKADGISSKVEDNTTKITKLGTNLETTNSNITELETSVNKKYAELNVKADGISSKVEDNTTKITKLGTNLETTNSNITSLETTVKENYSTLDQKADGISTKVASNTTSITKLGENLDTTNENVTSLKKTVTENYSTLDQKADGISTKVASNTTSITNLSENLDTTNSNITKLEKTVTENYSTLDQKADGISTKVASNTTSITKLGENLDTTNGNITALQKTVTENYSTLDQKADSISTTVSSHTKTIEGLDNRVTTNTENISKVKQTADGLTSTVTALDQTVDANTGEITTLKKSMSEIGQNAENIYLKIVNDLQETGIDIKSGQINLQATNTNIIGNLNVYKSDTGLVIYDDTNQDRVNISNHKIGKFNDVNTSANSVRTADGQNSFDNTTVCNNQFTPNWYCSRTSVQSNITDLGDFSVGDTIKPKYKDNATPEIFCNTSFLGTTNDIDDVNKNMPKCVAIDNVRVSIMKDGTEVKTYPIGTTSGAQNYFVDKYIVPYNLTNGIQSQQKNHDLQYNLSKVDGNGKKITETNLYFITLYWKFFTSVDWTHTITAAGKYSICLKGDLVFGPVEYLRDDATHGWGKKGSYSIGDIWHFWNEQSYLLNKKNPQRTVIGTDGMASIIGSNKLFYIGQDGIIAKWGNDVLKLDDNGISQVSYYTDDHGTIEMAKTLGGEFCVETSGNGGTAENPRVFGVLDGIDVVVTTGEYVMVSLPMHPKSGRVITVIPKAEGTWVNFNGVYYMRYNSTDRKVNDSIFLPRTETRKYVYEKVSNIWFEI